MQLRAAVVLMKPLLFIFKQAAALKSAAAPQIILSMFNTLLLYIFIVPGSNAFGFQTHFSSIFFFNATHQGMTAFMSGPQKGSQRLENAD